jgi:hypothetical protein
MLREALRNRVTFLLFMVGFLLLLLCATGFAQTGDCTPAGQTVDFALRTDYPAGDAPLSVAIGDLNGDGIPDLAVANKSDDTVSILRGNGDGSFTHHKDIPVGYGPTSVAIGDFDRDGKPELAVANEFNNTVSILYSWGLFSSPLLATSVPGPFPARLDIPVGAAPRSLAVGDFNLDGNPDLAVANMSADNVTILLGTGTGVFAPGPNSPVSVGIYPSHLALGDLDRDGIPDLVVANKYDNTVSILRGNGDGSFARQADIPAPVGLNSVALGDLNRDGILDLAATNNVSYTVSIFLGDGTGGFGSPTHYPALEYTYSVAIGDLSGDGIPDLAVSNTVGNTVSIFLGDGTGGFGSRIDLPSDSSFLPRSMAIGDLNRDGLLDLVVGGSNDKVSIYLNSTWVDPAGILIPSLSSPVGDGPYSVAIGDLNRDGIPDLVYSNRGDDTVSILLGNGDGTFLPSLSPPVGNFPVSVAIGDLNRDGIPDLVSANVFTGWDPGSGIGG